MVLNTLHYLALLIKRLSGVNPGQIGGRLRIFWGGGITCVIVLRNVLRQHPGGNERIKLLFGTNLESNWGFLGGIGCVIVLYNVISQYPRVREIIFLNRKRIITHLLGAGAGSSMRGIRACSLESRFWMSEPARIS